MTPELYIGAFLLFMGGFVFGWLRGYGVAKREYRREH